MTFLLTNTAAAERAFMCSACCSAKGGVSLGHGGPFGASIVRDGRIISCEHNTVLIQKNPTRHAEMNAVRIACRNLGTEDLSDCEIYTSCEPCPMCWGGIINSGIKKENIYIGVDRKTAAEFGFDDSVFYEEVCGIYEAMKIYENPFNDPFHSAFPSAFLNMEVVKGNIIDENFDNAEFLTISEYKPATTPPLPTPERDVKSPNQKVLKADNDDLPMEKKRDLLNQVAKLAADNESIQGCLIYHVNSGKIVAKRTGNNSRNSAGKEISSVADATLNFITGAVEDACKTLNTHILEECIAFCTIQPDVMALASFLWARVPHCVVGKTLNKAIDHYKHRKEQHVQLQREHLLEVKAQYERFHAENVKFCGKNNAWAPLDVTAEANMVRMDFIDSTPSVDTNSYKISSCIPISTCIQQIGTKIPCIGSSIGSVFSIASTRGDSKNASRTVSKNRISASQLNSQTIKAIYNTYNSPGRNGRPSAHRASDKLRIGVAYDECAEVFSFWQKEQGIIY